jgi:hypothetical protein
VRIAAATIFAVVAACAVARAEFTFERDIRPILKRHCFMCHGEEEKLRGGVDLRLRRFMLRESKSGDLPMVPGDPAKSEMLALVKSGEMPEKGKKLSAEEIAKLEKWIAEGAKTLRDEPESLPPGPTITEEERSFWSFQPVKRPVVPAPENPADAARIRTPVDAFLLQKLRAQGLEFAPDADKRTLLRRVTLDLTGLPPTPDELDAFLKDEAPDAYERVVDRLLASPAYGERWARHWLDAAGYADSNGYAEEDSVRPHAWRYRDYVIRSLNADKPWDQFIQEQLAGDEIARTDRQHSADIVSDPAKLEAFVATGFLRMGPDGTADTVADMKLAQNMVIADSIQIVGKALLGLTVDCARCHDHRYDPIPQADYYKLRAVFEPAWLWTKWQNPKQRLYSLYTSEERTKASGIEAQAAQRDAAGEALRRDLLDIVFEQELEKLPWDQREAVRIARETPDKARTPEQKQFFKEHPSALARYSLDLYNRTWEDWVVATKAEGARLRATKPPEGFVMALCESGEVPETRLFHRGDHDQPRQAIAPGELAVLAGEGTPDFSAKPDAALPSSGRRLAYAKWLTSGRHPLVARVLVNRFWLEHFGAGLVRTPGDFGALGERPTHPELLDWLASEFVGNGWRLKPLQRAMVLSTAYRQSSNHEAASRNDPENRLFGRWKLQRLDAETLRDAMLAVSGRLNRTAFGPPMPTGFDAQKRIAIGEQKLNANGEPESLKDLGADGWRRSIYVTQRRKQPLTVFETFDAPIMSPSCDVRASTTVAPQSLLLMNDTFVVDTSRALAERLRREESEPAGQIRRAWRLLFATEAAGEEVAQCVALWDAQQADLAKRGDKDASLTAGASVMQVLLGSNRFLYSE